MRRKFFDINQAHASPIASEAIQRIGQLYAIESEIRGRSAEERQQARHTRARPLLLALHGWFKTTLTRVAMREMEFNIIDKRLHPENSVAHRAHICSLRSACNLFLS